MRNLLDDPHESHPRTEPYRKNPLDERFLAALNEALATAPLPNHADEQKTAALPIVYIVGAPRSGTTLLSQLLSRHLPVGYIDNLIARFWLRPSVGITLSRVLLGDAGRQAITFASQHGTTSGVAGPHEFGHFWRRWLGLDTARTHHLTIDELAVLDGAGLRSALRTEILAPFNRPVVFKNVICGFQAAWLTALHPSSLFVVIERDLEPTCASILKSRLERHGSYDAWWSLKPSTYHAIAALDDPCAAVVRQVVDCRAEFRTEMARTGVNSLFVNYDELCREPAGVLTQVGDAVGTLGQPLRPTAGIPDRFEPSPGPALPSDLLARLRSALAG